MRTVMLILISLTSIGCGKDSDGDSYDMGGAGDLTAAATPRNPDTTPVVSVDRFSDTAAHLFKRSANPAFPAANAPINFDQGPFITHGLGPQGEKVTYYNFDVMPTKPAPIFVFFAEGASAPLPGQLNVIDVLPGDPGYNDFWQVTKVTVPSSYVANTVTSLAGINSAGFKLEATPMLVNCPVVPAGSTANLRLTPAEPSALVRGWYRAPGASSKSKSVAAGSASATRHIASTASGAIAVGERAM